ncbi:hypothetical protein ASPZODRAFT_28672 [Penicilliopsis zonata CBS 506.65]|uniref:Magnesium transporter n=1 Tax=Penicilliopsis zonata CBS 506.65 TaxID=1073090 RepID=A0A1L9S7E4_9EURO|nr:hypothetical protein ASPZODRAFT_28672 [Penicilliopsis zonata CBS 506.65]OJJ43087.1 hypothetical protein ASPZODRAFT_28672 [Penicilliopsis zonata CBS 506.65]
MLSSSPLKRSAPSASLLRFLRYQSDSLCTSPSSSTCTGLHRPIPQSTRQLSSCSLVVRDPSSWSRLDTTTTPGATTSTVLPSRLNVQCLAATNPRTIRSIQQCRNASTRQRPLLRRIFDLRSNKSAAKDVNQRKSAGPTLIDDGLDGSLFSAGRGSLAAKALNEPRLRCTEFDNNGNVTLVNGEFRKSELIAKYGLLPRDLRKIDSFTLPHILVRPSAILINLLHLRVLIKADRVLVFDAYGSTDSYMQSLFIYDLEGKLRQKQQGAGALPYELRALEAVLISVTTGLEEEFNGIREPVVRVLRALEEDIDRDLLRHLLVYSKKLGTFEQKARLVRDAIEDLLEADDDLASMYLSERTNGIEREEDDHQEVEMLLESYHKVCDEIVQMSGNLVTGIRNTEEVVKAILDANRNSLMLLDLKVSIGTLGLATGTLVSALYGMNLTNFIEESNLGFGVVSAVCFAVTAVVCVYGLAKLRKLQRVRMWGEAGVGGAGAPMSNFADRNSLRRSNWRADSIDQVWSGLPGEGRMDRLKRLREKPTTTTTTTTTTGAVGARQAAFDPAAPKSAATPKEFVKDKAAPEEAVGA